MKRSARGRRVDVTGRSTGSARFVQISLHLLTSDAWQSLGPVPRTLYLEVVQRWNGFNNGQISLGVRQAADALHVKRQTATNAFRELVNLGFLEMTRDSSFDQKRLTREWRATALPVGDCRCPTSRPTNDYARWQPEPEEKQKPGPFGGTHRAVMGTRNAPLKEKNPLQAAHSALPTSKASGHRAVMGPPSSYHAVLVEAAV